VRNGAVGVTKGRVAWIGRVADVPAGGAGKTWNIGGKVLTPGLVDLATGNHPVCTRLERIDDRRRGPQDVDDDGDSRLGRLGGRERDVDPHPAAPSPPATTAWAAASRAIGTRNGEHDT